MDPIAEALNQGCHCITVDEARLRAAIDAEGDPLLAAMRETSPHLFARSALFVDPATIDRMRETIAAVETVVATPAWQAHALGDVPEAVRRDRGPRGVFFGYDFHVGPAGPQLVEINTNAGGALLNLHLARAQQACCAEVHQVVHGAVPLEDLDRVIVEMFRQEWQLQRGDLPLRTIAIVDDAPEGQFMYPEFRLFARLFRAHGLEALIVGPSDLRVRDGALVAGDIPIDLVYARLCDFALTAPASGALREAWERDLVVLTPHPRAHALQAHKRNLVRLSDPAWLAGLGVSSDVVAILAARVPRTLQVDGADPERLWAERRQWFFKPGDGYGSRAAWRGDKLTRTRFAELLATGGYVAQRIVPPSGRVVEVDGTTVELKADLRAYTYGGTLQLLAARLYQGQTTNLRTPGGGFAPVFVADPPRVSDREWAAGPAPE